ncbi:hypothetical protein [Paucibacter sp. KCTC 42545]|uniref:hypothetical protein n=1 Tax=Paucibacter sp. KCTC 42545 TaxID=1768242 RepID=UPI0018D256BF|nr:hypothetical protein [Paucibacter sp. KCTC 42545]
MISCNAQTIQQSQQLITYKISDGVGIWEQPGHKLGTILFVPGSDGMEASFYCFKNNFCQFKEDRLIDPLIVTLLEQGWRVASFSFGGIKSIQNCLAENSQQLEKWKYIQEICLQKSDFEKQTLIDFEFDTAEAIRLIEERFAGPLLLVGDSLGGFLASKIISQKRAKIDAFIGIASPTKSLQDTILYQKNYPAIFHAVNELIRSNKQGRIFSRIEIYNTAKAADPGEVDEFEAQVLNAIQPAGDKYTKEFFDIVQGWFISRRMDKMKSTMTEDWPENLIFTGTEYQKRRYLQWSTDTTPISDRLSTFEGPVFFVHGSLDWLAEPPSKDLCNEIFPRSRYAPCEVRIIENSLHGGRTSNLDEALRWTREILEVVNKSAQWISHK